MESESKLFITDWRLEHSKTIVSQPTVNEYFYRDEKNEKVQYDYKSLRYLDKKAELDEKKLRSSLNKMNIKVPPRINELYGIRYYSPGFVFITTRDTITRIMNTPFEIDNPKKKWTIYGSGSNKMFYLKINDNKTQLKPLAKHYERLIKYLFVKKPEEVYRKISTPRTSVLTEIYHLRVGGNTVLYDSELPGITSDEEIKTIDGLQTAEHVYCEVIEAGSISEDLINYNPTWWAQAKLINAKKFFIGIYHRVNDDKLQNLKEWFLYFNNDFFKILIELIDRLNEYNHSLKEIRTFKIEKFDDTSKFENIWSPDAAWNFLDSFLTFAKDEIESVEIKARRYYEWKFSWVENDTPYISCDAINLVRKRECRWIIVFCLFIFFLLACSGGSYGLFTYLFLLLPCIFLWWESIEVLADILIPQAVGQISLRVSDSLNL